MYKNPGEFRHEKRLERIASYEGFPGPYYDDQKKRVINPGRGKRSKYLKRCANRTIRRLSDDCLSTKGSYKRQFDYWWELV